MTWGHAPDVVAAIRAMMLASHEAIFQQFSKRPRPEGSGARGSR